VEEPANQGGDPLQRPPLVLRPDGTAGTSSCAKDGRHVSTYRHDRYLGPGNRWAGVWVRALTR